MKPRQNKKISPKQTFSFVVDGECEYWYLQMLKDNERSLKITLSPEIYSKKSLEEQYKRVIELAKVNEKVFWVIDFDVINKETRERKQKKISKLTRFKEYYTKIKRYDNVTIIINNPCLEFWFLQHYIQTSKYFQTFSELEKSLKKELPNYEKTKKFFVNSNPDIYKRLKPDLPTAISNSQKIGEFDFDKTQTGITEMYKIFSELEIK